MASSRFGKSTEEERSERRQQINAEKTLKANKSSAKLFKEYLAEIGERVEFEVLSPADLDKLLSRFYMDLRRSDGESYKTTSMEAIRHGLNRYLKNPPNNKKFDITKGAEFVESNTHFKAVLVELKRAGMGDIEHYPIIQDEEIQKLYSSIHMNTGTPQGLYNKVQFDLRLYFCRRGNENVHCMTKQMFAVETLQTKEKTGVKIVRKVEGELTKNQRLDKENSSGVMPESEGSVYCPVVSFEKYLSKLHPDCNRLWQRPKESFLPTDDTWYCNAPVGEKKLKQFMTGLSSSVGLSKSYTNHSIRATGATILSKNMFNPAQIMSVTGHACPSSLAVYQRVGDSEKVEVGQAITHSITPHDDSDDNILPMQKINVHNELAGINCEDLFSDFEAPLQVPQQTADPGSITWQCN